MSKKLSLSRPLAVFDLETTGTNIETDRIVSIAIVKINTDGTLTDGKEWLINPEVTIPPGATKVHGITDDMVKDKPTFKEMSQKILNEIANCDLSGFNVEKFDLPLLTSEFKRSGRIEFINDAKIIDVMTIYHKNEKRDLSAAVKFYLNRNHDEAHTAIADTKATAQILLKQVEMYALPSNIEDLNEYCHEKPDNYVDPDGKLILVKEKVTFNFGKYSGKAVKDVLEADPGYVQWMLNADFGEDVKIALVKVQDRNTS